MTDTGSMALPSEQQDTIDELVATYRDLNAHVRNLPESSARRVHRIVQRMRNDEMLFAQALKERVTGVPHPDPEGAGPVLGTESEEDTVTMLTSQFGTARATTLSMLKALPAEGWQQDAGDGRTILDHVRDLTQSDANQISRIREAISS